MIILLIEDSELLGPMLLRRLSRRGHTVKLATCIAEAKRLIDGSLFYDAIVTDRDVPDGDAWAFVVDEAKGCARHAVFMSARQPKDIIPGTFFFKGKDEISRLFDLIEWRHGA